MNIKVFHLSVQGASHLMNNRVCQDASLSYKDDSCAIAVVCDGHGGDDYVRSDRGSKLACENAIRIIKYFIHGTDKKKFFSDPNGHLRCLEASIINSWNEAIKDDYNKAPFSEQELNTVSNKAREKYAEDRIESAYGTTLIAVAMDLNCGYWFGIQIGDGKCVVIYTEGAFCQPIPWDSRCFLNQTTSMCDSDVIERFRHCYSDQLPVAVFVGSDGIDDCFRDAEQLYQLYRAILFSFVSVGFGKACEELKDYLPRLSAKGSRDDMSVAMLLNLDMVPELSIVKEFDREKERARVAEETRKEAEKSEAEKRRYEEEQAGFQHQNNMKVNEAQMVIELDVGKDDKVTEVLTDTQQIQNSPKEEDEKHVKQDTGNQET